MTKIQISLRTIIGYEYFTMLDRVHSTRIHVDVWIEFLAGNLVASHFEQTTKGGSSDTFTKTGYDTACDKHVLNRHNNFLLIYSKNA